MIKDSLKKAVQITSESAFPILIWTFFNVIAGFFTTFIFLIQLKENESFAVSPFSIITWGTFLITYIYLHAATLAYVRNKILQPHTNTVNFISNGLKYFFPIATFNLIFFFLFILLALVMIIYFVIISSYKGFPQEPEAFLLALILIAGFIGTAILIVASYALCLLYAPTIIVAENSKVFTAIRKSVKVVRRYFWQTIGLGILCAFPIIILQMLGLLDDRFTDNHFVQGVVVVISALTASFFEVYVSSVIMNFYLRLSSQESSQNHAYLAKKS